MRWNCPHCETLVSATIDFENTKQAYVRCGKCKGMALIHRSAALADHAKAQRLESEAKMEAANRQNAMTMAREQAEAEKARLEKAAAIRLAEEAARANEMKASITAALTTVRLPPAPNREMQMQAASDPTLNVAMISFAPPSLDEQPEEFISSMMAETFATHAHSRNSFETETHFELQSPMEIQNPVEAERTIQPHTVLSKAEALFDSEGVVAPTNAGWAKAKNPPPFLYTAPPAFLMRENAAPLQAFADTHSPKPTRAPVQSVEHANAGLAVWIAAALAIASGIYLFMEGRKALAPAAQTISEMSVVRNLKLPDSTQAAD